jgi:GT2 family glycosyltransferase
MPSASPLVSFVILSWNRREDLRATLEEVRRQSYEPYETIVVENGSTDGTAEMVRTQFPDVHMVTLPENIGIEGLNVGLRAARGDVAVLLDDDSYPRPDAIARLVQAFERHPDLGIAACKIVGRSGREGGAMGPWRKVASGTEVPIFVGCGVGLRRMALERSGLFDGALFLYGNELDLVAKVLDAGYTVRYFPEVEFVHARSATNRVNLRVEYYGVRNLVWIIAKYFPPSQALALGLRVALQGLGYRLLKGEPQRAWAVARGLWGVLPLLRQRAADRRPVSPRTRRQLLTYIERWYPPTWQWVRGRRRPET